MHLSWTSFHKTIFLLEQKLLQSLALRGLNNLLCDASGLSLDAQVLFSSFYYFVQAEKLLHNSWCSLQHEEPKPPNAREKFFKNSIQKAYGNIECL